MSEQDRHQPNTASTPLEEEDNPLPAAPPPDNSGEESPPETGQPRRSVFPYLAALFGVAFMLLLFAYLMQQRDSAEIMGKLSQLRESMGSIKSIDQLTEENRQLREQVEALKSQTGELEQERDELKKELEISDGIIEIRDHDQQELVDILAALDTLARVRTLCGEERINDAREIVDGLPQKEGTDEVEYYLAIYATRYSQKNMGMADPELYNPLEEWQAFKDALAEEENAG